MTSFCRNRQEKIILFSVSLWMELLGLDNPGLVGVLAVGDSGHIGPLTSIPCHGDTQRVSCFSPPCHVASASLVSSLI